jgi:hypothetical protein
MKGRLIILLAIAFFGVAFVMLWGTVGSMVENEGQRPTQAVTLDVAFSLTDVDDVPLPGANVRVVFGAGPGAQAADAGTSFFTDASGEHKFTTSVTLDKVPRKRPTNVFQRVFMAPTLTDHLAVAADLEYMTARRLYAVDLYRFPERGEVLFDGLSVYTSDGQGRFTNKATYDGAGWHMPDLAGQTLQTPGYELWDFRLEPTGTADHWSLMLAFRKYPAPARR